MSGRSDALETVPGLAVTSTRQHGAVTRAQLGRLGVTARNVDHQLGSRRWQRFGRDVVIVHNGPLTPRGHLWAVALASPPGTAFGAWTALALWGLQGWEPDEVHIVVRRGQRPLDLSGVVVHESRRHGVEDVLVRAGLPLHSAARAGVDAAAWSRDGRSAAGLLAAAVQQRTTTVEQLSDVLESAGRVHHRLLMRHTLADLAGGSESLAEIDFVRLVRGAGLPEPARQARRRDTRGRWRYLDAEWELAGGRLLVVEVDGIGHTEPRRWYDDLMRTAELPDQDRRLVVRLPATAVRDEPDRVLAILRHHLRSPTRS